MDDTLLTRYLLGNLPEEDQVQIEDRAFSDPEYLAAIEDAEADLIDSYVRGELAGADRRQFERMFLASARRRSKVEFARALAPLAAEAPPLARRSRWGSLFANWNPGLRFAASLAAFVLVVGVPWLAVENRRMRSQLAELESQGRELRQRSQDTEQQLSAEKARAGTLAAELEKQQAGRGVAAPVIASLMLMPGLTRGEAARPQLTVPAAAQLARIQVQLEARDAYPRFRAELRTVGGQEVMSRGGLAARQTAGGPAVSFDVPASALAAGEYELELKGLPAGGAPPQELGYYYFRVAKP